MANEPKRGNGLLLLSVLLALCLGALFYRIFDPAQIIFANDRNFGLVSSAADQLPGNFKASWGDLNWVGYAQVPAFPNVTFIMNWLLGPVGYLKLSVPISLFLLGLSAFALFRTLGFRPAVCILGGLAAALNSNFFSNACWGQTSRPLSLAFTFFALACIQSSLGNKRWIKLALAGLCVGMNIMEGLDVGAIFSLYVGAFAVALYFFQGTAAAPGKRLISGSLALVVVVAFSGFMAYQAITSMVGSQIKVMGMEETSESKESRWNFATQWSLPKLEIFRVIVPGLFGYRMDTPEGGDYWGRVGEHPQAPGSRSSGAGEYAGVLVVLVALIGLFNAARKTDSPFTPAERKMIYFWAILALVSALLAFGRHAPFYKLIFSLPYFSTIRNPIKWMHPFHLSMLVLFGYGLQALLARTLGNANSLGLMAQIKKWLREGKPFDKKLGYGLIAGSALLALIALIYAASGQELVRYMTKMRIAEEHAKLIQKFTAMEAVLFVVFLAVSLLAVLAILSGFFSVRRARYAVLALGLLLVVDMARANRPWIHYINYKEKYASNPVLDILRQNPQEHRVVAFPFQVNQELATLQQVYGVEWLQHQFQHFNIQSLDVIQEPRVPVDKEAYLKVLRGEGVSPLRLWELTNTRLFLGLSNPQFIAEVNRLLDPQRQRFRLHTPFALAQASAGAQITAETNTQGPYAIIEFTGALPRVSLLTNWEIQPDGPATLKRLSAPDFNPHQTIIINEPAPGLTPSTGSGTNGGTVQYTSYSPKEFNLQANVTAPSVLLINDKFDPGWTATVNGKETPIMRCNFLVRGLHLTPGVHEINFKYDPPNRRLPVTLAALALGLMCCIIIALPNREIPKPPNS